MSAKIFHSLISAEHPLGRLLRLPFRLIPKGTVVPIIGTAARGKRWIIGSGPHSCWLGFNELSKRRLFARDVGSGDVVYDIGANVGSYTILASVLVGPSGRVVAFEPMAENLGYLRRHIILNNLENVDVSDMAVADQPGEMRFNPHKDRLRGRLDNKGSELVRSTTLDELLKDPDIRPPDFLKIDVEGGEGAVLRGAASVLAKHRPVIFLATHGEAARRECEDLLLNAGYRISYINRDRSEWVARPAI